MARSTCKEWFNLIIYNYFRIYLTRYNDWPKISDQLAKFTRPIGLHFAKNIVSRLKDINDHLLILTNLTSLKFDRIDTDDPIEWERLTKLSNLQAIKYGSNDNPPFNLYFHLPNVVKVHKSFVSSHIKDEQLAQSLQRWTNLQKLCLEQRERVNINIFGNYCSKLTSLSCYLPDVRRSLLKQWFNSLCHLKKLNISLYGSKDRNIVSFKALTALESVTLNGVHIHELNSNRLKALDQFDANEDIIEKESYRLVNLKSLVVCIGNPYMDEDLPRHSFKWLTALTALEHLDLSPVQHDALSYIKSPVLTSLNIDTFKEKTAKFHHLTELHSLKNLQMKTEALDPVISTLTQLEYLHLQNKDIEISLSNLTNLTYLTWWNASEIPSLPNLEYLSIFATNTLDMTALADLSRLTHLGLKFNHGFDFSLIARLTSLRFLQMKPTLKTRQSLTALTNLTKLILNASSHEVLQLPTSLQVLKIVFTEPNPSSAFNEQRFTENFPNLYDYYVKVFS